MSDALTCTVYQDGMGAEVVGQLGVNELVTDNQTVSNPKSSLDYNLIQSIDYSCNNTYTYVCRWNAWIDPW